MSFAHVVLVGSGLAHLDQSYTYRVPDGASVHIGSLVRVPVRGRSREGVVVAFLGEADVERVQPIRKVLGPGLTPDLVEVCRDVARHYLSSLGEALSAALPPRVASEEETPPPWPALPRLRGEPAWAGRYKNAQAMLKNVHAGGFRGFVWRPMSHEARGSAITSLASEALRAGRGVLVLLPEVRASSSVAEALTAAFGGAVAWLGSDRPARERYRAWLALRNGGARIAAGGRAAAFAPVPDLGLVIVDDEGHVSYKERRTPRFHARPVAFSRAKAAGATFVAVGVPPSLEAAHAADRAALVPVFAPRAIEMKDRPAVVVVDRSVITERHTPSARTISALESALRAGRRAVLLIHRTGDEARAIAARAVRILHPADPARLDARSLARDAEAFARALREADLIISTPVIAKDVELAGIGCVAVVEADAALATPEFRAAEEAFATWWRAGRWLHRDGVLVIETSKPRAPAVAALVRWDPALLSRAELLERAEAGYPPLATLVRIDAPGGRGDALARELAGLPATVVLGPVEKAGRAVVVLRSKDRAGLLDALSPIAARWRAEGTEVRIDVDPRELLP